MSAPRTVTICAGGECGGECYQCRVAALSAELNRAVRERDAALNVCRRLSDRYLGVAGSPVVVEAFPDDPLAAIVRDARDVCDRVPRRLTDEELGGRAALEAAGLEPVDGWDDCGRCGGTGVIRVEREPDGSGGGAVPCVCRRTAP